MAVVSLFVFNVISAFPGRDTSLTAVLQNHGLFQESPCCLILSLLLICQSKSVYLKTYAVLMLLWLTQLAFDKEKWAKVQKQNKIIASWANSQFWFNIRVDLFP